MVGDQQRPFEILVREHELALLAFVRSCVEDAAAADDLVQETFVAAWRQLDEYDDAHPFAAWLRGIARNKILGYYRSTATAARHVRILAPADVAAIAGQFDALLPDRGEPISRTLQALKTCLGALKPPDHDVIHRAYFQKQSCRTIADQLGRSLEATKKGLQRARARLRDCILARLATEGPNG